MIIGVLGNITIIIYTIFISTEKTVTSYLVGNLALADLLVCLTFYPIWMIEFIKTILNIDSDQDLFCKLGRSSIIALLFASVASLLAITVDKFFYIVKPLKYALIVTKRRVLVAMVGIWLAVCCVFGVIFVHIRKFNERAIALCDMDCTIILLKNVFTVYFPLTLIIILNVWILIVAEKQGKRIMAETAINTSDVKRFVHALKAVKTFIIVVAVLTFCVLTPTVIGQLLDQISACSDSCRRQWYVVFNYEFFGINSIVNAFIYGMRHIKYRKAFGHILLRIFPCNTPTNR